MQPIGEGKLIEVEPTEITTGGIVSLFDKTADCEYVGTPDRAIYVWSAYPKPDLHVRSNSKAALQRVLRAIADDREIARLGESAEYQYIRTLMVRGDEREDVFVYFSDPFIRRLVGPELKLTERRRRIAYNHLRMIGHGAMFKGSKGFIIADFTSRMIIPFGDSADMTYYKRRSADKLIPPLGGFQQQWIKACKGDLKTSCNFDYGGTMIEQMLLGLVAYRVGEKIEYDGAAGRVTNNAEADALLSRKYREGWTLDG